MAIRECDYRFKHRLRMHQFAYDLPLLPDCEDDDDDDEEICLGLTITPCSLRPTRMPSEAWGVDSTTPWISRPKRRQA